MGIFDIFIKVFMESNVLYILKQNHQISVKSLIEFQNIFGLWLVCVYVCMCIQ